MTACSISPTTQKSYGMKRVCLTWEINRSTIYANRKARVQEKVLLKRGPKSTFSDALVLMEIRRDLNESPFSGEGHRKVHARLRHRKQVITSRERVRKLMKQNRLLSPHRVAQGTKNLHEGSIITDSPNVMWATDATKIQTIEDGIVWFFGVLEHWNAECLGWRISRRGDRFTALDALSMALKDQFGSLGANCARGLYLRPDHGSQFTSKDYGNQIKYWGISASFSLVREPETNGVIERFHKTFKEQVIYGRVYKTIQELEESVSKFIEIYNEKWLLEKLGYLSPREARMKWKTTQAM